MFNLYNTLVYHILLLFHSPKGWWWKKPAKDENLGKYYHTVYCKVILKWTRTRYSTRLKDRTSLRGSRWPLDQNVVRAEINIGWVRLPPPIMIIRQPNKQIKNEEKINICYNVLKGLNNLYYSPHNLKLRSSEVIIVYLLYPVF